MKMLAKCRFSSMRNSTRYIDLQPLVFYWEIQDGCQNMKPEISVNSHNFVCKVGSLMKMVVKYRFSSMIDSI